MHDEIHELPTIFLKSFLENFQTKIFQEFRTVSNKNSLKFTTKYENETKLQRTQTQT